MKKIKKRHMSAGAFSDLMKSAEQALDYERGARAGYRVTRIAAIPALAASVLQTGYKYYQKT